jgi:ubiquinone/menaquinone biosynthesis C-methylase UbiE
MSSHGHRSTEEMIEILLSPDRAETLDPLTVISLCPVNPGDTVADIGCGPGYFTVPLAKFLYSGKVFALDTDQAMLDACRGQLDQARMSNVETLLCEEYEFPVEPGSLDGALAAFVVHHPSDPARFLSSIKGLLRPRGWCTVLEWQAKEMDAGPSLDRRIAPEDLDALARSVGFRAPTHRALNDQHYMMSLRIG